MEPDWSFPMIRQWEQEFVEKEQVLANIKPQENAFIFQDLGDWEATIKNDYKSKIE
jgi:hypothetical protein